jgi:hypothetical protein
MNSENNREWSNQFIPTTKAILGEHLIVESSLEMDRHQATDLILLNARNLAIACRVRRPGFAAKYPYQFTLRSRIPSGKETELQKITNGWADYLFYGHAVSETETTINPWFIINLKCWRAHMIRRHRNSIQFGEKHNPDGTAFVWFDLSTFPPEPPMVLASSLSLPSRPQAA